jgi:hypothetical protein
MVPEPQHRNAFGHQKLRPFLIVGTPRFCVVLSTVQLYRQLLFMTVEIEDIRPHRMLTAKFTTNHLPVTQQAPQQRFGNGLLRPQGSGVF